MIYGEDRDLRLKLYGRQGTIDGCSKRGDKLPGRWVSGESTLHSVFPLNGDDEVEDARICRCPGLGANNVAEGVLESLVQKDRTTQSTCEC